MKSFDKKYLAALTIPHHLITIIRQIGESAGRAVGVPFLYRDFRAGWREGVEESKRLGLYRQQYCGCIYSEKERFFRTAP